MKNYLAILFLLVFTLPICKAQDTVKRSIPLLKESTLVDSLISSIINIPAYLKATKDDSCIVLGLSKNDVEKFIYGVHAINHRETIFDLGGNLKKNKRLGYFEFDGYLIFVYGGTFMNRFFVYTETKKKFTFVTPKVEDTLSMIRNFMSWAVIYRNGELYYGVH